MTMDLCVKFASRTQTSRRESFYKNKYLMYVVLGSLLNFFKIKFYEYL